MSRYRRHSDYGGFPRYVPVSEKQSRNRKAIAALRKRDPDISPVVIDGSSIATSWWGKSWNANLERYADYANRIGRGRSYVRHGAVLDLRLEHGTVTALVQGSRRRPYEVRVIIDALPAHIWDRLRAESAACLDSLTDLLAGKFPKALKDTFFAVGTGLFPSPGEISFECSCPDWADMCKHVAATLYGIGNRLDAAPELLFSLRRATVDELIAQTVDATAKGLVSRAEQAAGDEVLADTDLSDVFGIEMDLERDFRNGVDTPPRERPTEARLSPSRKAISPSPRRPSGSEPSPADPAKRQSSAQPRRRSTADAAKKAPTGPRPDKPATRRRASTAGPPQRGEMVTQLLSVMGISRKRFTANEFLEMLPGWSRTQVVNTIQRAVGEGLLKRVERGTYRRA